MWKDELGHWKRTFLEVPLYALLVLALVAGLAAYQVRVPQAVDVGGPYDAPYLSSFHAVEPDPVKFPEATERFRWTRGAVGIEFMGLGRQPVTVGLRMRAYRPEGQAAPEASLWAGGQRVFSATIGPEWDDYVFLVPSHLLNDGDLHLELHADTFRPSGDARDLGVTVDRIEVAPRGRGWVEPSWYQVACLVAAALLAYLLLRRLGLARGWTALAAGSGILLLAYVLAWQRLALTYFTTTLTILLAVGWGVTAVGLPVVERYLDRAAPVLVGANGRLPLQKTKPRTRAARLLWTILLLGILLRLGGMFYPQFRSSDLLMHVHNVEYDVLPRSLFFTEKLPDIELPVPYPPGLYVTFLPLTLLSGNLPRLLEIAGVLLDALAGLLLYVLARRLSGRRDVALIAVLLQQVAPVTFLIFSTGNYTNVFSRVALLATLVLLAVGRWRRPGLRGWAVLSASFTLVLLSHLADSLLFGGLVLATAGLALLGTSTRPAVPRLMAALLAAGVVVLVLYYSAPPMWLALRGALQALTKGTGRSGGWLNPWLQFVGGLQAPLALLFLPGLALLPRVGRRWTAVVLGAALLTAAVFGLGYAFFGFSSRYDYFVLPVLALGTALLLSALHRRRWAGRLAVGGLLAYLVVEGVWAWWQLVWTYLH